MQKEKTFGNINEATARQSVPDIEIFGDGDIWQLICKASSQSEGWMKSTKAMDIGGGCLVQVTTQQRNLDGSYALAEALTWVPGAYIKTADNGRRIIDFVS